MLIFDHFPDRCKAVGFASHVRATTGRDAKVYATQAESDAVDPFPFVLVSPIVLVSREDDLSGEEAIELAVYRFGGECAGT